jgi:CRP-like cAMP-binding protein
MGADGEGILVLLPVGKEHMAAKTSGSLHNHLLLSLPQDEFTRLAPKLEPVELTFRQILAPATKPTEHVYFPQAGMVSLVKPMQDGALVEVGLVGREGFVGIAAVLGGDSHAVEQMVQIAGTALRISVNPLRKELARSPVLSARLFRYAQALFAQVSQTAACNGRHTVQERLARWLLMARDRIDNDIVPLSHELLSMMLGTRRPGITVALGAFRQAGLVHNTHGKIEILDRPGLEAAACECYGVVREEFRRLLA